MANKYSFSKNKTNIIGKTNIYSRLENATIKENTNELIRFNDSFLFIF